MEGNGTVLIKLFYTLDVTSEGGCFPLGRCNSADPQHSGLKHEAALTPRQDLENTLVYYFTSQGNPAFNRLPLSCFHNKGKCVLNLIYIAACSRLLLHSVIAQRAASCDSPTRAVIRRDTCFLNPHQGIKKPSGTHVSAATRLSPAPRDDICVGFNSRIPVHVVPALQ